MHFRNMKSIFLIASFLFMDFFATAQPKDSFSILLHKKVLLKQTNAVSNNGPQVMAKRNLLKKKGLLTIQYKPAQKNPGWERIFQLTDTDNTIQLQKGFAFAEGTYGFNTLELLPLLEKNKKLLIYTYQQPTDPLLAGIRVERLLLCELVLE
jgi:hypothetical protein